MGEIGAASAPHLRPLDKIWLQMSLRIPSATGRARRRLLQAMATVAACGVGPPRLARAMSPERTAALLKARLAEQGVGLVALQVDKGSVAIAVQGSAGDGQPLGEDARFELGSITKTFTALLLADAVVRRNFALDDPVESALPPGLKVRDAADAPIRWLDLATHRSGLPRLPSNLRAARPARSLRRLRRGAASTLSARLQAHGRTRHALGVLQPRLRPARLRARPRRRQQLCGAARRARARAAGHAPVDPGPAGADDPRPGRRPRHREAAPTPLALRRARRRRRARHARCRPGGLRAGRARARQHAARRGLPPGAATPWRRRIRDQHHGSGLASRAAQRPHPLQP